MLTEIDDEKVSSLVDGVNDPTIALNVKTIQHKVNQIQNESTFFFGAKILVQKSGMIYFTINGRGL